MGCGESKATACVATEAAEVPREAATGAAEGACACRGPRSFSDESTASGGTAAARSLCLGTFTHSTLEGEHFADSVSTALSEADRLLHDNQALRAEEVLARALEHLDDAGLRDAAAAEAARVLRASDSYAAVRELCQRYDEVAEVLKTQGGHLKLVWEDEEGQLWLHKPADETWLEFKIVSNIDAPLSHCLACGNEVSLIPEFEPNVVGTPTFVGESNAFTSVVRVILGVMLLRLELMYEIRRFYNAEHGFLAESIRSDFPVEGRPVPPRHWRHKRMRISTSNVWIPQGGGREGTTLVQSSRVDAGFRMPDFIVEFFFRQLAPSILGNLRRNATAVGSPDGPYVARLAADTQGVYAECARVEEAASRRRWLVDAVLEAARETLQTAGTASLVWAEQTAQSAPDRSKWWIVTVVVGGLFGRLILVWYGGGEAYWHERLLLCKVRETTWIIVTPDGDVYPEDIRALGGRPCLQGSVPPAIPADAMLYRFPPLGQLHTAEEWAGLGIDDDAADAESGAVRDRVGQHGWTADTGLPAGPPPAAAGAGAGILVADVGAAPVAGGLAAPPAVPLAAVGGGAAIPGAGAAVGAVVAPGGGLAPGMQWIVVANDGHPGAPSIGTDWSVDANAVVMGKFALDKLGSATLVLESIAVGSKKHVLVSRKGEVEQAVVRASGAGLPGAGLGPQAMGDGTAAAAPLKSSDARVLPVLYDQMGQRFRAYSNAVGLLEEPRFDDFPAVGPRTTLWLCRFIRDQGSVPRTRTEKWMRDAHVPDNDRVRHEHGSLMEILETALTYDQLDVSAPASFEILSRRVQLLEEAYTSNPKAPRFDGSEHFQGLGREVAAVAPQLTSHAALQLQGEAAIQKERRKGCGEFLTKAWQTVGSVTFYPCLDIMTGKALAAHSVVEFSNVFVAVLGSTGGEQARAAAALAREAAEAVPLPKERPAPQEALAALLRTDTRYGDSECAGNIAPFGSASASLPSRDLRGVDIYNVLPSDASHKLKRFSDTILLSDEEYALRIKSEGLPNLYFDPVLEAQTNIRFDIPDSIQLATGDSLSRLERASDQTIFSASFDIKDYFHELRIDEELSQYFALPAVRASAVGVGSINGVKVGPSELIYPLAYVGNFGAFGCDKAEVEATHRQALEGIRQAGFHVHEIEQVSTSLDIVGVHLDGDKKVVRLSSARARRLHAGLHALVRRGRCTGREMRAMLGHLCFAFLLRRPCLSCVAASFAFAEAAGGGPKNLWPSAKRELLIAAAILPLVYADLGAGWLDQVVATDACDTGLGVCAAEWGSQDIRITGSYDERWRFKKDPLRKHREVALAGYDHADPPIDRDGNLVAGVSEGAWLAIGNFPDVPPTSVRGSKWAVVAKRPCGSHEGAIHVKEARGAKLGLKHVVRCGRWRHSKVLMLVDNMSLALAMQKGRCRDPALLGQLRQMAALQLATGLRVQCRWIPSEAAGSGPSEQAILARPPATRAEPRGGSRRSRVTTSTRLAAARRSASSGGLSYLESIAVKPVQIEDYHRRIEEFYEYARRQGLNVSTLDSLETALLDWADEAYLEGRKKHDGEKLKAAVLHYYPNLKRPNTKPLARFERCLKAWGRRRPALGRLPPPYPTICGLAVALHLLGRTDMAVAVLVALSAYLRPGELRGLRVRDVVPPALGYGPEYQKWSLILGPSDSIGGPTKTGVYDDNVTMDHENLQFLDRFFELHRQGKGSNDPLWGFTQAEFGAMIAKALKVRQLEGLGIAPYSLRRAGPSWDAITGRRSQLEVQRRGRWASMSSLIRYEKSSKVNSLLVNLDDSVQEYLRLCTAHL
ncbi:unnamed protein product, partial [Prorocentrum cordatum]